jgi:hypothetical protein
MIIHPPGGVNPPCIQTNGLASLNPGPNGLVFPSGSGGERKNGTVFVHHENYPRDLRRKSKNRANPGALYFPFSGVLLEGFF